MFLLGDANLTLLSVFKKYIYIEFWSYSLLFLSCLDLQLFNGRFHWPSRTAVSNLCNGLILKHFLFIHQLFLR